MSEADGTNPKLGFDTSLSATNVLSDWTTQAAGTYTLFRRIASVLTDSSSNILAYTQIADRFIFDTPISDTTTRTNVITQQAMSTPLGITTIGLLYATMSQTSSSGPAAVALGVTGGSRPDSSERRVLGMRSTTVSSPDGFGYNAGQFECETNTSSQIKYRIFNHSNFQAFDLGTLGWIDNRGKDE